jgi:hypothetical protein
MINQIEINGTKIPLVEVPDIEHPVNYSVDYGSVDDGNFVIRRLTAPENGYFECIGRGRNTNSWSNIKVIRNGADTFYHEEHSEFHNHTMQEKVLKGDIVEIATYNLQGFSVRFYPMKVF